MTCPFSFMSAEYCYAVLAETDITWRSCRGGLISDLDCSEVAADWENNNNKKQKQKLDGQLLHAGIGLFWSGCWLEEKKLDGQLLHAGIRLIWRLCYGYMMLMLVSCQVDSTCVAYLAWWLMYASIACTLLHLDQPLAPPVIVAVTSRNRRDAS